MVSLLHAAISSGLNRDSTLSRSKYHKPNLLRRLWQLVAYSDYYQLMLVGYATIINHEFRNLELPSLNTNDPALQHSINEGGFDGGEFEWDSTTVINDNIEC